VEGDAELARDRARILVILCSGAIGILVLLPVAHEKALDIPALVLQEERGDGGIHAAG
jgi:hypothetical protein